MLLRISKIILVPALFIVTTVIVAYLTVHLLIRSEKIVVIPDLKDREVVYALKVLTDLKLNFKVKDIRFDPRVPRHHIVAQEPEPGTRLKQGRDVRLIISQGPRKVVVPAFTGSDLAQARILLDQNGLRIGKLSYIHHEHRTPMEVLSQFPSPGKLAIRGNAVDLLVNAGTPVEDCFMTDLHGLALNQAVNTIEQHRLVLDSIDYADAPGVAERTVTGQSPPAGHPVPSRSGVRLTITRPYRKNNTDLNGTGTLFRHHVADGFIRQQVRVRLSRATISLDIFDDYVKPGREIWLLVPDMAPATIFVYVDDQLIKTEQLN